MGCLAANASYCSAEFTADGVTSGLGAVWGLGAVSGFGTARCGGRVGRGIGAVLLGTPRRATESVLARTGRRSTNTHPTCGTGLPPSKRPMSKSHVYWS